MSESQAFSSAIFGFLLSIFGNKNSFKQLVLILMAVAAYGSLQSLAKSLIQTQQLDENGRIMVVKKRILYLQNQVKMLLEFLEDLYPPLSSKIETFVQEIKVVAVETEILIDAQIVYQLSGKIDGFFSFTQALGKVIQKLDSWVCSLVTMKAELVQYKVKCMVTFLEGHSETDASLVETMADVKRLGEIRDEEFYHDGMLQDLRNNEKSLIGIDNEEVKSSERTILFKKFQENVSRVVEELTSHEKGLQVIWIVGMCGIGKTTLAKHVFNLSDIREQFDVFMWCKISQNYDIVKALQSILQEESEHDLSELIDKLYTRLDDRRYLIVLDDIWSVKAWERPGMYFPDNNISSRIIVTTRMSVMDDYRHPHQLIVSMPFLDEESSWDLLRENIFHRQQCPSELERIGRQIAKKCEGLPLTLVSVGEELSRSMIWEKYAQNMKKMDASLVETMADAKSSESTMRKYDRMLQDLRNIEKSLIGVDNEEVKSSERTILLKEFQENVSRVVEELTSEKWMHEVIWIVGMCGIGKTTLAKYVYNLPIIREQFHVFMWCKISQNYDIVKVLQSILQDESEHDLSKLEDMLHQRLYDRRYLIVLDDIWSMEDWERLKTYFSRYHCKSRIIVTSRMSAVVDDRYSRQLFSMPFLDDESSWDLLRENIFHGQQCPSELERIGRQIAKKCAGLPLTLVSVGEELSRSIQSVEIWDKYAENMKKTVAYQNCLKRVSSSYNDLPIHLKLCLLYFSRFCESTGMDMEDLVTQLMLEGFVKPISDKTMEDVAHDYVKQLIDKSVVLVLERDLTGEVKTCGLHDLIHDLCLSESHTENFVLIPRTTYYFENLCCMCGSKSSLERMDISHIVSSKVSTIARRAFMYKRKVNFFVSKVQAAESSVHDFVLPLLILRFWNLQVLHVKVDISTSNEFLNLPNEIWEMHQLRELFIKGVVLHKPRKNSMVLEQLETLCADSQRLEDEVVKGIPNVKRLELYYEDDLSFYLLYNVATFLKLESLVLDLPCEVVLERSFFPKAIKKLSISCKEDITAQQIGTCMCMPNLEILQLKARAFVGKWSRTRCLCIPKLKVLVLQGNWEQCSFGKGCWFPSLKKLVLQDVTGLKLTSLIGDWSFHTPYSVHLNGCDERTIESAIGLLKRVNRYFDPMDFRSLGFVKREFRYRYHSIQLYVNEQIVHVDYDDDDDLWSTTDSE